MIQSLKRLVRQMWVGARPAPTSEALMMTPEDVATFSAQARIRRENLKRAMEAAFASPVQPLAADVSLKAVDASVAIAEAATQAAERKREFSNDAEALPVAVDVLSREGGVTAAAENEIRAEQVYETQSVCLDARAVVSEGASEEAVVEHAEAAFEPVLAAMAGAEPPKLALAECAGEAACDVLVELMPGEGLDHAAVEVGAESAEMPAPAISASDSVEGAVAASGVDAETVVLEPAELPPAEVTVAPTEVAMDDVAMDDVATDDVAFAPSPQEVADGIGVGAPDEAPKATRAKKAAPKKAAATPKKKAAAKKKSQTLEDEVWVSDAVAFSLSGTWPDAWVPPVDEAGATRLEEFRTKAAEGTITIWGRAGGDGSWEPIKPGYWKSGSVEPMSFLEGREHVATEGKKVRGKAPAVYSALKISKAQVEELWGSLTTH